MTGKRLLKVALKELLDGALLPNDWRLARETLELWIAESEEIQSPAGEADLELWRALLELLDAHPRVDPKVLLEAFL